MTVPPPIIDHRTYEELVEQTVRLVEQSGLGWVRPQGPQADVGLAMIRLFGHLAKRVGDRLNRVPDKNLLAFLELIGTQLQPPQPARVPLTFTLATGTTSDAFVPARTQVAAPPRRANPPK